MKGPHGLKGAHQALSERPGPALPRGALAPRAPLGERPWREGGGGPGLAGRCPTAAAARGHPRPAPAPSLALRVLPPCPVLLWLPPPPPGAPDRGVSRRGARRILPSSPGTRGRPRQGPRRLPRAPGGAAGFVPRGPTAWSPCVWRRRRHCSGGSPAGLPPAAGRSPCTSAGAEPRRAARDPGSRATAAPSCVNCRSPSPPRPARRRALAAVLAASPLPPSSPRAAAAAAGAREGGTEGGKWRGRAQSPSRALASELGPRREAPSGDRRQPRRA